MSQSSEVAAAQEQLGRGRDDGTRMGEAIVQRVGGVPVRRQPKTRGRRAAGATLIPPRDLSDSSVDLFSKRR
ncbi:unnamed protein product [Lampetra planeri]